MYFPSLKFSQIRLFSPLLIHSVLMFFLTFFSQRKPPKAHKKNKQKPTKSQIKT